MSILTMIDQLDDWKPSIERPVIITDHLVEELYGASLSKRLDCPLISIPPGEMSKEIDRYLEITRKMVQSQCTRRTTVIALGGGVVGDLAGFVASTYMRGVSLIQIPTTLLGMVDSSIGGKVGINLPEGKNLLGAFHQPQEIVIPLKCLETLPDKELRSGLSEVVKYGMILDAAFFKWLEENIEKLLRKDPDTLKTAVKRCAELKMEVVEKDAKESDLRQILNYGHTFGHALEKITGYQEYTHGEAIALGMRFEGCLATEHRQFSNESLKRQNALLDKVHPGLSSPQIDLEKLIESMKADKKAVSGEIVFVLPKEIGKMARETDGYGIVVPQEVVHETLRSHYSSYAS